MGKKTHPRTGALSRRRPKVAVTLRPCLKCREPFESSGKGHRMCPRCHEANSLDDNPMAP